jgi:ATP-dependent exoDNAse (exonuclease V) beta subunit
MRASKCPEFGIDTVLGRPNNDLPGEHTIRPGAHGFGSGPFAYSVVWWDPKTLELGKTASFSIRQQELLEKGDDKVKQRRLSEYQAWRDARQKTIEHGSAPTVRFQTATERAKTDLPISEVVVEVVEIARVARPYGPRFGSLVHATLAAVPLAGDKAEISAVAELQGRILGATDTEVRAAIEAVGTALLHPLMQRAQAAALQGKCYRELPLTLRLLDCMVVEGIADLVFCEGDRWIVVDFKTDQELAAGLENYRRQLAIYATAVSAANAAKSEAFLLRV